MQSKGKYIIFVVLTLIIINQIMAEEESLYNKTWVDFNKNGKKEIYENQKKTDSERIDDLISRMNLKEKTCQLATLYGYGNFLDDQLPKKNWKNEIFIPDLGINSINGFDITEPWMVYAEYDTSFSITGEVAEPSEYQLNLSAGWNYVPYLRNEPIKIEIALQSMKSDIVIVLDPNGNVWIPDTHNSIGKMQPGEAYRIYLQNDLNFTYPPN